MRRTVTATEAHVHFGELLRRVVEERTHVVVERAGKPLVVVLSIEEYERLQAGQPEAEDWRTLLAKTRELTRAEVGDSPPLPVDDLIHEMREERDAQLLANLRQVSIGIESDWRHRRKV